ncbi:MAG: FAD-dependent oxidoreductase, partial [Planctomycetota bacterium]
MRLLGTTFLAVLLTTGVSQVDAETVLVEAEGFENHGGWVVDQQFMDQMGSPFLLAHGLGKPVDDAATTVDFPAPGRYRVLVRTRDWVAPWNAPGAPGRFQLLVDGRALETTFGAEGAPWHWQEGGTVEVDNKQVSLALHDLTGFDGRCDAVLFTTEADFQPPNEGQPMATFRRRQLELADAPEEAGRFDLVVVGGGMAGTCTAVSAARLGLEVALIQNRPVLGGNNSSEVRVHLGGKINQEPYPALGNLVREIGPRLQGNAQPARNYEDERKRKVVEAEQSLHLFLNTHVFRVEMDGSRIVAAIGKHITSGKELRFEAPLFADCTGDGNLGCLAGADYRMGRESREETDESLAPEKADRMTMGTSVMWYAAETDQPAAFPECPWAAQFDQTTYQRATRGDWNWETGMNRDQIAEFERIRDYGLRVVFGNWSYLKNHSREKDELANHELAWVAYIGGKRESRRLLGDVILQQQDVEDQRAFPDASVTTTWTIDLHYPDPNNTRDFPGEEFRSIAE